MRSLFASEQRSIFENPAIPLTSVALLDIIGGQKTDAGVSVSEESAMTFLAVNRCVTLLSGLVAGLPLKTYRYSDKQEVTVKALTLPNSNGSTQFEIWEVVMIHLLLWGNAYVHKVRNQLGTIVEIRPIHPSRVRPEIITQDESGDPMPPTKAFWVKSPEGGSERLYTNFDILHIPGPGYDGVTGMSPIKSAKQAIAIGLAADKMAAKLYGNGALLSGVLQTDKILTQPQSDALKSRWREKIAGLNHGHDIAVMDGGTKFQPISMPPEAAQFLQSRRWQVIDIARWFGIPPHLVGDVEKSTSWGTGIEQQNLGFVTYTLRNWITRIEQRITWEIVEPKTQYAQFKLDGLLRGSTAERYAAYAQAIQWGWMTRNEVRRLEDKEPIEGLDEPLQPVMMAAATVGGETPVPGSGAPSDDDDSAGFPALD